MNEFTKEDLEKLYALCLMHDNEVVSPLRVKLLYMIDNYCDHENLRYIGDVYGYECKDCDKELSSATVDADAHYRAITEDEISV